MKTKRIHTKHRGRRKQRRSCRPFICDRLKNLGLIICSLKYPLISLSYILGLLFASLFPVGYAISVYLKWIDFDPWHLFVGIVLSIYLLVEKRIHALVEGMYLKKK